MIPPSTEELHAMGVAWAEEHWAYDRAYDRFGLDWAYAALAGLYADVDERSSAAYVICDHARQHFDALRARRGSPVTNNDPPALSAGKITIHCKLDDSPWYSATSAFALCETRCLSVCASREMFGYILTSHRADDACRACRAIVTGVENAEGSSS